MASKKNTQRQEPPSKKNTQRQEPPGAAGLDLGGLLGGLTQALGGVVGTAGQVVGAAGQTVSGLLTQLGGTLEQLQRSAEEGDEEAGQVYDEVLAVLRKSAGQGKGDAKELLNHLGESQE